MNKTSVHINVPSCVSVASWGVDDRYSSYRMKNFGATSSYVENRIPSATANPYLVMAVTIAAGLDGVANKLEPPPQRDEKNVEKMPRCSKRNHRSVCVLSGCS